MYYQSYFSAWNHTYVVTRTFGYRLFAVKDDIHIRLNRDRNPEHERFQSAVATSATWMWNKTGAWRKWPDKMERMYVSVSPSECCTKLKTFRQFTADAVDIESKHLVTLSFHPTSHLKTIALDHLLGQIELNLHYTSGIPARREPLAGSPTPTNRTQQPPALAAALDLPPRRREPDRALPSAAPRDEVPRAAARSATSPLAAAIAAVDHARILPALKFGTEKFPTARTLVFKIERQMEWRDLGSLESRWNGLTMERRRNGGAREMGYHWHRQAQFPLVKYPGATPPRIEPHSSRWEASCLTTTPPRPLTYGAGPTVAREQAAIRSGMEAYRSWMFALRRSCDSWCGWPSNPTVADAGRNRRPVWSQTFLMGEKPETPVLCEDGALFCWRIWVPSCTRKGSIRASRMSWTYDHAIAVLSITTSGVRESMLRQHRLYPFHIQALGPADFEHRLRFAQWIMQQCTAELEFALCVLFTDEACFTRDGYFNTHNSHLWVEEGPRALVATHHQRQFAVNPYHNSLANELPQLLEDVQLNVRVNMWFQHNGAPPHFSHYVRQHLTDKFGSCVYSAPVDNPDVPVERIQAARKAVKTTPGIFERVCQAIHRHCNPLQKSTYLLLPPPLQYYMKYDCFLGGKQLVDIVCNVNSNLPGFITCCTKTPSVQTGRLRTSVLRQKLFLVTLPITPRSLSQWFRDCLYIGHRALKVSLRYPVASRNLRRPNGIYIYPEKRRLQCRGSLDVGVVRRRPRTARIVVLCAAASGTGPPAWMETRWPRATTDRNLYTLGPDLVCVIIPPAVVITRSAGCRGRLPPSVSVWPGNPCECGAVPEWKDGEMGELRGNPRTGGIVRHDSQLRKPGDDPARNRNRFAQVGGENSNHCTSLVPARRRRNILQVELQHGFRKVVSNREWILLVCARLWERYNCACLNIACCERSPAGKSTDLDPTLHQADRRRILLLWTRSPDARVLTQPRARDPPMTRSADGEGVVIYITEEGLISETEKRSSIKTTFLSRRPQACDGLASAVLEPPKSSGVNVTSLIATTSVAARWMKRRALSVTLGIAEATRHPRHVADSLPRSGCRQRANFFNNHGHLLFARSFHYYTPHQISVSLNNVPMKGSVTGDSWNQFGSVNQTNYSDKAIGDIITAKDLDDILMLFITVVHACRRVVYNSVVYNSVVYNSVVYNSVVYNSVVIKSSYSSGPIPAHRLCLDAGDRLRRSFTAIAASSAQSSEIPELLRKSATVQEISALCVPANPPLPFRSIRDSVWTQSHLAPLTCVDVSYSDIRNTSRNKWNNSETFTNSHVPCLGLEHRRKRIVRRRAANDGTEVRVGASTSVEAVHDKDSTLEINLKKKGRKPRQDWKGDVPLAGFVDPESGKSARRPSDDQPEQLIIHESLLT
ncbi:hypothetical protein PR048_001377 [Dryococelus australis]|uniref:Uncharacterized protein n=1 Tax=Dryococelus australis TaxID=614101 RepID=A0ABQ9IHA1_9NEOP|nr:hypothetical protein PR048_001377 [Dryococelus australis]